MDQNALVGGRKLVSWLKHDGFDVIAAFWLKAADEAFWYLYIASNIVDQVGPIAAYKRLQTSLHALSAGSIPLEDIKLIGKRDSLARDMVKLQKEISPIADVIHLRGGPIGGVPVEEAYIYPLPDGDVTLTDLGDLKLGSDVEELPEDEASIKPEWNRAISSGLTPSQADYLVRKAYKKIIPAGTVVRAKIFAFENSADPLLLVETSDGRKGLAHKSQTAPISSLKRN